MAVYPTKTNELNIKNTRLKRGITLTSVFFVLLALLSFNFFKIFNIIILGSFGLLVYPLCIFFVVIGILNICNKEIVVSKRIVIYSIVWLCVFTLILQAITSKNLDASLGEYLLTTFKSCSTAGGVLFGIILYPIHFSSHLVATYVILAIALVIVSALLIDKIYLEVKNGKQQRSKKETHVYQNTTEINMVPEEEIEEVYEEVAQDEEVVEDEDDIFIEDDNTDTFEEQKTTAKSILGLTTEKFEKKDYPRNNSYIDKLEQTALENEEEEEEQIEEESFDNPIQSGKPNIFVHEEDDFSPFTTIKKPEPTIPQKSQKEIDDEERKKAALDFLNITQGKFETKVKKKGLDNVEPKKIFAEEKTNVTTHLNQQIDNNLSRLEQLKNTAMQNTQRDNPPANSFNPFKEREQVKSVPKDLFDPNLTKDAFNANPNQFKSTAITTNKSFSPIPKAAQEVYTGETSQNIVEATGPRPVQLSMNEPVKKPKPAPVYRTPPKPYVKPPIDLLRKYSSAIEQDEEYIQEKGNAIVETLKAFKIPTKIINAVKGPTFTRFELQMAPGIPAGAINNKVDNLAMALESVCRLQVPIPGKNAFGIEVPNKKRVTVGLREIIESPNFQNSKSPLTFALGKDITNECKVACVDKLVHTLVAGATGAGKSVCLNTLLISLLYKASPADLRLLLIDPKTLEFSSFNNLPHMLIPHSITECEKAVDALDWLVKEMDNRYRRMDSLGVKKISEYNDTNEVRSGAVEKMYYIVVVFDEVGDFMARAKKDIEEKIRLLAAKSRACGIHLILATQRPTVDVITGTIKANLPSRIAFTVNSAIDSKTILESSGAEFLLGMGDMLYSPYGSNDLERIQGCFADNDEVKAVLAYVKEHNEAVFDESIEDAMFNKQDAFDSNNSADTAFDPLLKDCLKFFIKTKRTSSSSLQSNFGIGYPRANKIVMQMEKASFLSPVDSKGRRNIYISPEEFASKFGEEIDE
ncbi:MAG: hypothetical protein E7354_01540 [Clostridiales bacterium]|nr:hypothetical protein [Clostridiales bacterium]